MTRIRPIKDLRKTAEISEMCHESDEPLYITKNGYGDLVVMSIEAYEKAMAKVELYEKLAEAEAEIANGENLLDGKEVFYEMRKKYGREKL